MLANPDEHIAVPGVRSGTAQSVLLFQPKYRLDHPENYLFLLSKIIISGSKYPTKILFIFEKRSTKPNVLGLTEWVSAQHAGYLGVHLEQFFCDLERVVIAGCMFPLKSDCQEC